MLNKTNFEIANLCAKSGNSGHPLHGIRVTPSGTTVTDSYVLLEISTGDAADHFDPFILSSKTALKIAAAMSTGSKIPSHDHADVEHIEGEAAVKISVRSDEHLCRDVYSAQSINGKFPNTDKIVPAVEGAALKLYLDLDLLVPLLEQIRRFHGKQNRSKSRKRRIATFRFYKNTEDAAMNNHPQRIDAENDLGQKLTAVIMPCRE